MEQYKKFNWEEVVERAVKRRKELRFTQKRLALVANISTPTVSRFENNDKDIKLYHFTLLTRHIELS